MTNKQKALEISRKHQIEYLAQVSNTNYLQKISSDSECFGSALEMAKWKDQQFKEYLEKEREELLEQIKKLQSRGNGYDNFEECYTYMAAKLLRIIEKYFGRE